MSDINWGGLVQRTNPFGEFADGMARGQDMRRQKERDNLFAQKQAFEMEESQRSRQKEEAAAARQAGVGSAIGKGDYAGAREAAGGDLAMLKQIGELDEQQRKVVQERNGTLVAYLSQLPPDPNAAKAMIMQDAPALKELGFTDEQIAGFQPTPQNIALMKAKALGLEGMLKDADRVRDDKRASEKDAEMSQYREDMLGLAGRRVGVSERREGRVASGGGRGGAPAKLPSGFILD
jgi:hypothetical protein